MKPILLVILLVQIGIIAATAVAIAGRGPTASRPTPLWRSLALPLAVVSGVSFEIADRHDGAVASEVILVIAGVLAGMALCCALIDLRERRWGGQVSPAPLR